MYFNLHISLSDIQYQQSCPWKICCRRWVDNTLVVNFSNQASSQAVTFAIRSGLVVASNYAFKTLSKLLDQIPQDDKSGLEQTRAKLQTKILIISPAIDLIELISARGNTSLASTQELTKGLKHDIDDFDQKVEAVYELIETSTKGKLSRSSSRTSQAIKEVRAHMDDLLFRIEEAIPLISLALTTSGANLSSSLPHTVSPGRLLQASNFLTRADALYDDKGQDIQVGPSFSMVLYSIFYASHRNPHAGNNDITWKEEYAKCTVSLWRRPSKPGLESIYNYELVMKEDLDDGRYHEDGDKPRKMVIDVRVVTRLFFSASGRLLEIEESNSPVLVLKLNESFRTSITKESESFDLAEHVTGNVEWVALEIYDEDKGVNVGEEEEEEEDNYNSKSTGQINKAGSGSDLVSSIQALNLGPGRRQVTPTSTPVKPEAPISPALANVDPSLSLLEYLIRLSALQANDQESIYQVHDERLSLYLRDEGTGAYGSSPEVNTNQFESPQSRRSTPPGNKIPRTVRKKNQNTTTAETPGGAPVAGGNLTPWENDRIGNITGLRRELYSSQYKESPLKQKVQRRDFE
jgi:RanGTP-binding protein